MGTVATVAVGLLIGFELAFASQLIGEHAALSFHRWLLPEGSQQPETEVTELQRPTEPQELDKHLYGSDELKDSSSPQLVKIAL